MSRWVAWVTLVAILLVSAPNNAGASKTQPLDGYNERVDSFYRDVCVACAAGCVQAWPLADCRPPPDASRRRTTPAPLQEIAPRIPATEHYLDYTGASLYWNSQIAAAAKELQASIFGNPHSTNPSSMRTEAIVEQVRSQILEFFGADPEQYDVSWRGDTLLRV